MNNAENKEIMSKNLKHYLAVTHRDRKKVCADLNISYSTFTDWVNGNKYPRIDKIELLANYFGVQKSELIEEHLPDMKEEQQELSEVLSLLKQHQSQLETMEEKRNSELETYKHLWSDLARIAGYASDLEQDENIQRLILYIEQKGTRLNPEEQIRFEKTIGEIFQNYRTRLAVLSQEMQTLERQIHDVKHRLSQLGFSDFVRHL